MKYVIVSEPLDEKEAWEFAALQSSRNPDVPFTVHGQDGVWRVLRPFHDGDSILEQDIDAGRIYGKWTTDVE